MVTCDLMPNWSGHNCELTKLIPERMDLTNQLSRKVEDCPASSSLMIHGLADESFPTQENTRRCQPELLVDDTVVDQMA